MLIYGSFEFSSDRSDVWSGKHSIIIEISTGKCCEPALMFNNIEFYEQFWMVSSSCSVTLRTDWRRVTGAGSKHSWAGGTARHP